MLVDLSPYVQPLSLTPRVLRAVIEGRPEAWLDRQHAEDVMSPRRAVAHLMLTDRDFGWITRIKWTLGRPIEEVEEDEITSSEYLKSHSVAEILDEFDVVRPTRLRELQELGLTEHDLDHPSAETDLGHETVRHLLNTWVAHDFYHLGQIFKSFSAPYTSEIGPYQVYLNLPHFN